MDKREKVLKGLECCTFILGKRKCNECPYAKGPDCYSLMPDAKALLNAQEPQWTPIAFRALTEEEKAEHPDWYYIIDSPTPDDGEDILVSDGKNVWADVWSNNGEWCGLERGNELEGVAWMKMPTPWRKEANT